MINLKQRGQNPANFWSPCQSSDTRLTWSGNSHVYYEIWLQIYGFEPRTVSEMSELEVEVNNITVEPGDITGSQPIF
jgi:hypothetical protein